MGPPPTVTGLSPIEGVPGTKVTIRGEFLGTHPEDLVGLVICGVDCLLTAEWKSCTKLIARSGAGVGKGDVIVTTQTGGRGTSTVQFKGDHEVLSAVKESAVWFDESIILQLSFGRQRPLSPSSPALHDDPLGLSVEGNTASELDADLPSLFPGQTGDLTSGAFSPAWFLLEQHRTTSFPDLKAGLLHLERKVNSQKEGQISFLKANVGSVLEQLDTLLELKVVFESDTADTRTSIENLEAAISKCKSEADQLFEDVLQRKDKADSTRNALNVLHRFRFLLYLPVSIERNMAEGNYDVIINDYARAKSLFGDTQLSLFEEYSQEVERRINQLRDVLWQLLRKLPAPLEHHKKIIRNLQHLETSGDPAWESLVCRQSHLLSLLDQAKECHLAKELADRDHGSSGGGSALEDMGTGGGVGGAVTPAAKYSQIMASSVGEYQSQAPVRVMFVEAACEVLGEHFPDLWRLSQAYFGGELLPIDAVLDSTKQPQCKSLLLEVVSVFRHLVRGGVLGQGLPPEARDGDLAPYYRVWPDVPVSLITPWMPQIIRQVRGCYSTLLTLDLPNDALDIVANLLLDLRGQCLQWLFQQTVQHVKGLHSRETWLLEEPETSHAPGYTHLPGLLEGVVLEAGQLVKEVVLEAGPHETSVLQLEEVRRDLITLLHNVLVAFAQCLEHLCLSDPDDPHDTPALPPPRPGPGDYPPSPGGERLAPPGIEKQVLITLSNCAHMRLTVLRRVADALVKMGYPEREVSQGVSQASSSYAELQERLLEAYLEERSDPVIGMIERSMYLGGFDWSKVYHPPSDARTYVKEILLNITHVQAEVVSVWSGEVAVLVGRVVEGVGEEVGRLLSCVGEWSSHGVTQAVIDVEALVSALSPFMTKAARASFDEALELFPALTPDQLKQKSLALTTFRSRMRMVLACFTAEDSSEASSA